MTALGAEDLVVAYGPDRVLDGVAFSIGAGEIVGLVGPNGAGKTTLLRALSALQPAQSGRVQLDGQEVAALDPAVLARRLAYLPQGAPCHWPLTVERLVALGRLPHRAPWSRTAAGDARSIRRAMAETGVDHLAGRVVTTLSGGERMRVMLARALAGEPEVLLADEPVANLDARHQLRVMDLLRRMAQRGGAVVVVLHDLTLAARFCHRVVLLSGGRVVADGAPAQVLTDTNLETVFAIRALTGKRDGALYLVPWEVIDEKDVPREEGSDDAER